MKTGLYLLLFSFFGFSSYAQTDSLQYFDAFDRGTTMDKAAYYRKMAGPDSNKLYLGTEYWMDGHIKVVGHSLDQYFNYKIGRFVYYYKNGNKSGEGQFYSDINQRVFGFKNKKWETWYPDGKPREEWIYKIADDFAYSESFLMSFWDTTGKQLTTKGNGTYYYTEMVNTKDSAQKIIFSGPVHQGRYDSVWTDHYLNGKVYAEEQFLAGKFIKGKSFDGAGKAYSYDTTETLPEFPGGEQELNRFIKLNIQVPPETGSQILGKVYLRVFVGRTGFVGNVTVLHGASAAMNGEAVRVARALPRFMPATNRGQPVDSYYTIPVSFNLQ